MDVARLKTLKLAAKIAGVKLLEAKNREHSCRDELNSLIAKQHLDNCTLSSLLEMAKLEAANPNRCDIELSTSKLLEYSNRDSYSRHCRHLASHLSGQLHLRHHQIEALAEKASILARARGKLESRQEELLRHIARLRERARTAEEVNECEERTSIFGHLAASSITFETLRIKSDAQTNLAVDTTRVNR